MNWGVYFTSRIDGPTKRSTACDYSEKKTDEETLIIGTDKYGGNINLCLLAPTYPKLVSLLSLFDI